MPTEKISVTVPGAAPQVLDIEVNNADTDKDIALRLSKSFPPGTLLGVSGVKWFFHGPDHVDEVTANDGQILQDFVERLKAERPKPDSRPPLIVSPPTVLSRVQAQLEVDSHPKPGDRYMPKDTRRKSSFVVKEVTETELIAEDGRRVALDRLNRYVLVPV